ncbi:DUF159 domain protein [Mucor ambiguus]|uniref:DUF159 domain protein n=1 Tax=Mucor ambiguus TaxID=91626 RepID=A0A0C9N6Q5_9FUNG|nr:DUF159 domain protein [Mucor ambiguus]
MCGRFCCSLNTEELRNELHEENVLPDRNTEWVDQDSYRPSFNVCPSRSIPAVLEKAQTHTKIMQSMQWGFIPSWLKSNPYSKPINARIETLTEKSSMFDKSKNANRCIIAAEGFFEWNRKKQAFFIKRADNKMMLFAGLYSTAYIDDRSVTTCTLITTAASEFFSKIHDRMPVILEPDNVDAWINSKVFWSNDVIKLLKPFDGELNCHQVTDKVGSVKNDSPDLVQPLDERKSSISHFLKPARIKDEISKDLSSHVGKATSSSTATIAQQATKKRKKSVNDDPNASKTPRITSFFDKK